MAAISGRKLRIKWNGNVVLGATSEDITINNEPIDITDKDDAGNRTLMADFAVRTVDATLNAIFKDDTLLAAALGTGAALLEASEVEIEDFGSITGNFFLNNVQLSGPQDNALTYTASLQSSGLMTYTPE
jgi:predicted secreted protein